MSETTTINVVNIPNVQTQGTGEVGSKPVKGWRFWLVILAMAVSAFTSALDLTAVSTALPVIADEFNATEFVWIGAAYALASTAFLPMSGGLAQVFGRRNTMLSCLLIFAIGSAMCGASPSMNFLIAARVVQGVGAGGITSLTQIILSDIVPLRERGMYNGLIGAGWAIASAIGPLVGGEFAERGNWRWLFYLSIFTSGLSGVFVAAFLHLKTPTGALREKLRRLDWIGNCIVVASSTSLCIALASAGIQFPWSSARILVPLILGLSGLGVFLVYEATVAEFPVVPFELMRNRTSLSGYLQTFIMPIVLLGAVYYLPVYFQAVKGSGPINSGVLGFGLALTTAPFGILFGASVARTHRYRPQAYLCWSLAIIGAGLLTLLKVNSSKSMAAGFEIVLGIGLGGISTLTYFPVLSPLPVTQNAQALAFFAFTRNFGQIWGVTIGATVLQNGLVHKLPSSFIKEVAVGGEIAYSIIPLIPTLNADLRQEAQEAFTDSLRVVWQVLIGIAGIGLLASFGMAHVPLHTHTDEDWQMEQRKSEVDSELLKQASKDTIA